MLKRKVIGIIAIIIIILMLGTVVKAESGSSFKATVSSTKTSLKPGEEITVTVSVADIQMGEKGINTIEGNLQYDKDIFEEVKSNSIQAQSNWTTTYNDESSTLNGKFLAVNLSEGVKENTNIFSVKFKVKKNITESKTTQINFKDITSNDGADLVSVGTKSVNITINVSEEIKEESKNEIKNEIKKETEKTQTIDNTKSKTILPKTGISQIVLIILVLVILFVITFGLICRKYKDVK